MSQRSVSFTVPGAPVGKGRPRAFRRGNGIAMHTPEKTANYEALVRMVAAESMAGAAPMLGAVAVDLCIDLTPPASWSNRKRDQAVAGEWVPTSKPDIDNTIKAIFDAMNGVVWGDDRQVAALAAKKQYAATGCVRVTVTEGDL